MTTDSDGNDDHRCRHTGDGAAGHVTLLLCAGDSDRMRTSRTDGCRCSYLRAVAIHARAVPLPSAVGSPRDGGGFGGDTSTAPSRRPPPPAPSRPPDHSDNDDDNSDRIAVTLGSSSALRPSSMLCGSGSTRDSGDPVRLLRPLPLPPPPPPTLAPLALLRALPPPARALCDCVAGSRIAEKMPSARATTVCT
jgi:hypothetical protein